MEDNHSTALRELRTDESQDGGALWAHQIRGSLAVISGNAQFLSGTLRGLRRGRTRLEELEPILSSAQAIEREAERCSRLAVEFLQPRRGRALDEGPRREVDLHLLLAELVRAHAPRLALRNIRVIQRSDPRGVRALGDADLLYEAFRNLLVNAEQAVAARGEIEIRTNRDPPWAVVVMKDSGPGIPQEILPRIFDPFFTTKPAGQGTGLGLPIAASIIRRHGGEIEGRSNPGEGATFRVRLPLQ